MEKAMRIAAIADKIGRIQYNRMLILKELLKEQIAIDVYVTDDKPILKDYDVVYYTHFNLCKKIPYSGKKYASITSHKCLNDINNTLKILKQFDSISVNNRLLYQEFKNKIKNLYLTPNGVDIDFFSFKDKEYSENPIFGWVGNRDRATKNYNDIVVPLKRKFDIISVAPSKKDNANKLLTAEEMREFYHSIHYFLVTSSTEGTPNPGLEAMSCGVPVITTPVGNMIDIVVSGVNGFYAKPSYDSFVESINSLSVDKYVYDVMRKNTRQIIEKDWDWKYVANKWEKFFKQRH